MAMKNAKLNKCVMTLSDMFLYRSKFSSFFKHLSEQNILDVVQEIQNSKLYKADVDNVRIIINFDESLNLKSVKSDHKNLMQSDSNHIDYFIIILNDDNARTSKGKINALSKWFDSELPNKKYEIFYVKELLFNISKHCLVPTHELINNDEIQKVKEKYSLDDTSKLPWIRVNDPMSRFIGANTNDVIKITRHNKDSGNYLLYRYCIQD